ncbi:MAG: hypothetical protein K6U88_16940 [Dehalococcoidia bacterium]|nr:hypothetical protein [Dehalococcoidia bacterium]
MARKRAKETSEQPDRSLALRRALTAAGWSLALVCALAGTAFFVFEWDRFLSRDPRFRLPEEDRPGAGGIFVEGNRHVPRAAVLRVFEADRGRGGGRAVAHGGPPRGAPILRMRLELP